RTPKKKHGHKVSDTAMSSISEKMVNDAQQVWCHGLVRIGDVAAEGGRRGRGTSLTESESRGDCH
ncbi:MAG: hypothetical protein WA866_26875, partial [Pseudolabrys sp.]